MLLPQLLKFGLIFWRRRPYAILDSLVNIVIISASNNQPNLVIGKIVIPLSIDIS